MTTNEQSGAGSYENHPPADPNKQPTTTTPRSETSTRVESPSTHGTDHPTGASAQDPPRPKQRRGFAAMDPEKQRAIASKGGKASHAAGTGHEWDSESAREAGRKGGLASRGGRGKPKPITTDTPTGRSSAT